MVRLKHKKHNENFPWTHRVGQIAAGKGQGFDKPFDVAASTIPADGRPMALGGSG
jgi:hypothetical protein